MELLAHTISKLWEQLDLYNVPILDITFKEFLVGILMLFVLVGIFNFFMGKHYESTGK